MPARKKATRFGRKKPKSKSRRRREWDPALLPPPIRNTLFGLVEAAREAVQINDAAQTCPQFYKINLFKIAVYRFVRGLFAAGRQNHINQMFSYYEDERKTISFECNPYNWALLAIDVLP